MTRERLSRLQRRILAWLDHEDQRVRGTLVAEHHALVLAMQALGYDKANMSTSSSDTWRESRGCGPDSRTSVTAGSCA